MRFAYILSLMLFSVCLSAQTISGRIVSILDGDTFKFTIDGKIEKIRLADIDAPEKVQEFGGKSKEFLESFEEVEVSIQKKDIYGRYLAYVYVGETCINEKMVEQGYAWKYRLTKSEKLDSLQAEAKKNKRGLWTNQDAIDPYEFRKLMKKN